MARRQGTTCEQQPLTRAARRAIGATLRAGAIHYERARHLPRLIRAVPSEYAENDTATTRDIIARLEQAISAERRRGRTRHWSYDINRHIALMQALRAERDILAKALQDAMSGEGLPLGGR